MPSTLTFDTGTIPEEITGTTGGIVDRADAIGGTAKALRFADIDDSEETYFELNAFAASGDSLTVRYEVSSENNYDFFRILIDNIDVLAPEEPGVSGDGDGWQEFTTALDPGAHTIRFLYTKDSSADDGDDTAYISSITYPAPIGVLGSLTSTASGEFKLTVRYWQIFLQGYTTGLPNDGYPTIPTGTTHWGWSEMAEIEFRGTIGGADLTTPGGTTFPPYVEDPTSGTVFPQYAVSVRGGHGVDKAFDNDPVTTLRCVNNHFAIGFTFASPVHIAEVAITSGATDYSAYDAFTLEWSEDGYRSSNGHFVNSVTFDDQKVANLWGQVEWSDRETRTITWADQDYIFGQAGVDTFAPVDLVAANGLVLQRHSPGQNIWLKAILIHNWDVETGIRARAVVYAVDPPNWPKPGPLLAASVERTSLSAGWCRYEFDPPVYIVNQHLLIGIHADSALRAAPATSVNANDTFALTSTYGDDPAADLSGVAAPLFGRQLGAYGVFTLTEPPGLTPDPITGTASLTLESLSSAGTGTASLPAITGAASLILGDLTSLAAGVRALPNTFRQRVGLTGTRRPTKTLHATWVPR